jgi:hypothetical protein
MALLAVALAGCGGSNKSPAPLTEEQQKKIAEEDSKVADEESQGQASKKKVRK